MLRLIRTDSNNPDFLALVKLLDAELARRDGDDHAFYAQFNKTANMKYTLVAYEDDISVGCGAIREFDATTFEVKRMYVSEEHRGKGIATNILAALESWAAEMNTQRLVLETGKNQPEALAMYHKSGYKPIANYGPYAGLGNSQCFEKMI